MDKSLQKDEERKIIEGILFISERYLSIDEISEAIGKNRDEIKASISQIKESFEKRESFIEIVKDESGKSYRMQIKPEIRTVLSKLYEKKSLSPEIMKTLAFIALKQPVRLEALKKARGYQVRDHVNYLIQEGYIEDTEPDRRTVAYKTTLYFANVFNLDPENVKATFIKEMKKRTTGLL